MGPGFVYVHVSVPYTGRAFFLWMIFKIRSAIGEYNDMRNIELLCLSFATFSYRNNSVLFFQMFYVFDLLIYVIYRAYVNTKYDAPGVHIGQTLAVFAMTIAFPGGMYINYLLAEHWSFYRKLLDEYLFLDIPVTIIYTFIVHRPFAKRYTDEKIEEIAVRYADELPVSSARFLIFLHCLGFIMIVMMLFVYTVYAIAKPGSEKVEVLVEALAIQAV